MAFRGIPFDSKMVLDSFGTYEDRQVFSEDIAKYFGFVSSDGICLKDDEELTSQLLVEAGTGSEIILNPGTIKIQGRMGWITEPESLFANPGGALPRIDSAVIELNLSTNIRGFVFKIVEGEESSNPEPPTLIRTPDVWQLGLGNFYRPANSTSLGEFTDTRLDSERCGISKVATPNIGADTLTLWQESYPEITNLNDILYLIGSEGLPEEFGGTHSKSLPESRQNINFIGRNPIASLEEDTTATWAAFGTGVALIDANGIITNKPNSAGGFIFNQVTDSLVYQVWYGMNGSAMTVCYRAGNANGWYESTINWVKALNENNGIQIKKLWTNASPTSSFEAQTISLDLSEYDFVLVVYNYAKGTSQQDSQIIEIGKTGMLNMSAGSNGSVVSRKAQPSTTGVYFEGGNRYTNSNSATNDYVIPISIYGIKGVQ